MSFKKKKPVQHQSFHKKVIYTLHIPLHSTNFQLLQDWFQKTAVTKRLLINQYRLSFKPLIYAQHLHGLDHLLHICCFRVSQVFRSVKFQNYQVLIRNPPAPRKCFSSLFLKYISISNSFLEKNKRLKKKTRQECHITSSLSLNEALPKSQPRYIFNKSHTQDRK